MTIAYFDCFSGISGDMVLGAFMDLGVPSAHLIENLERLPLSGFQIAVSRVSRHGIGATDVHVAFDERAPSRDYGAISELIRKSPLSGRVKRISLDVFEKIADAEAAIHGCEKAHVHFHEVGGIDAIVDIVGAALCVEFLGLDRFIGSRVPMGRGFVASRHGTLPVPAPATLAILKKIPIYGVPVDQELVTPTGAAILAALCGEFGDYPGMTVEKTGYGAGKKELASQPNLLRIVVGNETRSAATLQEEDVVVVEANIDDMNPELFGYLMDRLLDGGALDVFWTPVQMKKNRPGTMVTVLCGFPSKQSVIDLILSETTSLGVRSYPVRRHTLRRDAVILDTAFGPVKYKRVLGLDGGLRLVPEFEECKRIALQRKVPLRDIYQLVAQPFGRSDGP